MTETIEMNLQECFKSFSILPGAVVHDSPDLVSIRTDVALTFTNGVAFAHFPKAQLDERVCAVIDSYRAIGRSFRWWVTPASGPGGLPDALERNRMKRIFQIPALAASLDQIDSEARTPGNFTFERVLKADQLRTWAETFAIGFEMPGESTLQGWFEAFAPFGFDDSRRWRLYIGRLDGEAVAISAMFLGSEAAGIYHVVTLEGARGLGIGSKMTISPLEEAREKGYKVGVLQSSDMGLRMYERIGFRQQFVADFFIWRPEY